jgi:hypothetical protein
MQYVVALGKTYLNNGYNNGYDGLHIISASTGTHIKSWYHSTSATAALSLNQPGGSADMMADGTIFWVRNNADGSLYLATFSMSGVSP